MSDQDQLEQTKIARRSRQNLVFALLSLIVSFSVPLSALLGSQAASGTVSDFPEFYAAAKMSSAGEGVEIYKLESLFEAEHQFFPAMQGRELGFYIPPFAVPLLGWLSFLAAQPAYLLFASSSLAALLASIYLLRNVFQLSTAETLWLSTLFCASAPVFESLKLAQLAPFLLFALSACLWLLERKQDFLAGAALALLLLKPQELFPVALLFLTAGKWKTIAGLLVVALFLAVV